MISRIFELASCCNSLCIKSQKTFTLQYHPKKDANSKHYGNIGGLKSPETEQLLIKNQQHSEHGTSAWIFLYCTDDGGFEFPGPQMIPNIVLKTWYTHVEGPAATIYQIYSNGTLSDKAVYEMCQTEYGINHRKIRDLEKFVSTKIKAIKQEYGFSEAWRWAKAYTYVTETKSVSTLWSVYFL